MKTLYFDCSSGISGNMVLGALTEIIGNQEYIIEELKKLNIDGYQIDITKKDKNGISGTHVNVIVDGVDEYGHEHTLSHDHDHHHESHDHDHHHHENHDHGHNHEGHDHGHHHEGHSHSHHHVHRNLADVNAVIDNSSLDKETKDLAKRIFLRVAKAESKVHGKSLDEVHFHEVGAVDSIVDIVGTAILINYIKPDRIISSIVNEGHGFIRCAHGLMSVPVPATSEIFAASDVKFRQIDVDTELVTPTGAAIIAELADSFIPLPPMKIEKLGWGAGTKDIHIPNLLKVYLGNMQVEEETGKGEKDKQEHLEEFARDEENFVVIESNIDDCNGEILAYTMEKLFAEGALDVFFTPVIMKKSRPAYQLTVTCNRRDLLKLAEIIFTQTTTIGLRYRYEKRIRLDREEVEINSPYGIIKGKKVSFEGDTYIYPEYESARQIAELSGIPLKELYKL